MASWKDLERDPEAADPNTSDHIRHVLARIGDTPDGKLLRNWLREAKIMVAPPAGSDDSALRDHAADQRIAVRFHAALEPLSERQRNRKRAKQQRST